MKKLLKYFYSLRRFFKRIFHRKINIVFVCHRPNVWGSLKTVYEACLADSKFNVIIVPIPNKKQLPDLGLAHDYFESEGAEDFFRNFDGKVINGYNYENKKWLDLRKLNPDYVFFQQPYNVTRCNQYLSKKVSVYSKLVYIHYAANFIGGSVFYETYPIDFIKNVSFIFTADKFDHNAVSEYLKNMKVAAKAVLTGFPRYDELEKYKGCDSDNWNYAKSKDRIRVIWTPRWCANEGNCCFFDYKDVLLDYVEKHPEIDFIFRPHPQAFLELAATGELPPDKADEYKQRIAGLPNAKIDSRKEYLTTFYSSDILITDISSIVAEYFLTGKPVVYCHKKDCFNDFSRKIAEGFYWVRNWDELQKTIEMLKSGDDPLKEKRQEIIKSEFYIPKVGAGETIKNIIKEDFYGKR